jgi:hypothetical protein
VPMSVSMEATVRNEDRKEDEPEDERDWLLVWERASCRVDRWKI